MPVEALQENPSAADSEARTGLIPAQSPQCLPWVRCHEILSELATLNDHWDGAKAPAPGSLSIEQACAFLRVLEKEGVPVHRLAPSVVGGVGLTFLEGLRQAYVEFRNKGTVRAVFFDGTGEPRVERIAPEESAYAQLATKITDYTRHVESPPCHEQPGAGD